MKNHPNKDTQFEFECIMERLTRDLNLCRISPSELLTVVLPSKALKNERIMETLMMQVNLGTYRMQELDEYRQQLRSQESAEATVQVHRGGWDSKNVSFDFDRGDEGGGGRRRGSDDRDDDGDDEDEEELGARAVAISVRGVSIETYDALDNEVEMYASFELAPSTSRVAAQMQKVRRKRWAADGASGSSDGGGSNSGRRH